MKLTDRQREVLEFIEEYIGRNGISPSVREICEHLGLKAPAGVHRILKLLEKKGLLVSSPGKKRTWRPAQRGMSGRMSAGCRGIPILGRIAAGLPLEAVAQEGEELPLDCSLFGGEGCFALRVKGDSMTGLHIADGDVAIIRPCSSVENGQVAAVLVDGLLPEATLKIVKKREGGIELHAANPLYEPMVFEGEEAARVRILGILAGIVRRMGGGL